MSYARPNTIGDLAREFGCKDIQRLAEVVMGLALGVIQGKGVKAGVLDMDSTLVVREVEIAEETSEGDIEGRMAAFSVFLSKNAAPQSHNLSLVGKFSGYLKRHSA